MLTMVPKTRILSGSWTDQKIKSNPLTELEENRSSTHKAVCGDTNTASYSTWLARIGLTGGTGSILQARISPEGPP